MDYGRPELADRLGAEYAAGTLRGRARHRLEALLPAHPQLRAAVRGWEDRLTPLTLAVAPVTPPRSVWLAIERRIGAAAEPGRQGGWNALPFWRALAGFATAAALGLALLLATPEPAQPPIVVVLAATGGAQQGQGSFVAGLSADGTAVVTRPIVPVNVEAGRALELWAVPAQGAPTSLGLISEKDASVVQRGRVPAGTAALAVSLEPQGGSPTGAPTGPVLFVGKLAS